MGAFATLIVATATGLAQASTIPDATYYNAVNVIDRIGNLHSQNTDQPTAGLHVQGEQIGLPFPVFWNGTTNNNYNVPFLNTAIRAGTSVEGSTQTTLTYYVEFTGNTPTVSVGVKGYGETSADEIDATAGTAHAGDDQATVLMYMTLANDPRLTQVFRESANTDVASNPGSHLFSLDQEFTVNTNTLYQVFMTAYTSASDMHWASAYLDPYFTVPDGYSIMTSAGIGNSPAPAPIPVALPLFTTGLGALGLLGWRRKKAAAPAARTTRFNRPAPAVPCSAAG